MDLDQLKAEANAKGMQVVDNNNLFEPEADFVRQVSEALELCNINDPDETPFLSKYKARDMLDKLLNKMDASRTVAKLEGKRDVAAVLGRRISHLRTHLGTISWECEEPQNAQTDLEAAMEYYAPEFVDKTNNMSPLEDVSNGETFSELSRAPDIDNVKPDLCVDIMKCLNMLGILWAGRGNAKRSFLYLIASKEYYDKAVLVELSSKDRDEMESTLTHNLFYLAQAYGNIGNVKLSSLYCHMTLQRQLVNLTVETISDSLEWVKNSLGLADFYMSLQDYEGLLHVLSISEYILNEKVKVSTKMQVSSIADKVSELELDISRRYIRLDVNLLRQAYEQELLRQKEETIPASVFNIDQSANQPAGYGYRFHGVDLPALSWSPRDVIDNFEKARVVYLRCVVRLEAAKKKLPLDGFVTDHVTILQEHSSIYHYLAIFEKDFKRKMTMEQRRIDLLKSIPDILSRTAFENIHKQVSYELAETYMGLYAMNIEKLARSDVAFDERLLKPKSAEKLNEYCEGAVKMYFHFIDMFTKPECFSKMGSEYSNYSCEKLASVPCVSPKENLLSKEELRPFLNAHFLSCRMISKMIPLNANNNRERAMFIISALRRYQWILSQAENICKSKDTQVNDIFKDEFHICKEMVDLLPSKIDRIVNFGESSVILG